MDKSLGFIKLRMAGDAPIHSSEVIGLLVEMVRQGCGIMAVDQYKGKKEGKVNVKEGLSKVL